MDYQNTFQQLEQPSQTYLSCYTYAGKANDTFPRHCHSYYEISFIMKGCRYETLNNERYEVGDHTLIFIPPLTIHNLHNKTEVKDIVIQFDQKFLRNSSILFDSTYFFRPASNQTGIFQINTSDEVFQILNKIYDSCNIRENAIEKVTMNFTERLCLDLELNSLCLQLISMMIKKDMLSIEANGASYSDMLNFDSLLSEILSNMDSPIDMKSACHKVGLSYSHFSRTFEKITGFHYTYFCNLLRIRYAEDLLISTSLPISEIADAIGISTISYFTRLFKNINGITPSSYRKKYKLV